MGNIEEYLNLKVNKRDLEDHVKRICRSNLKRPCKICTKCPILEPIIKIMDSYGWAYNREGLKEAIERYQSKRYKKV